jgi:hypothetical protein
MSTLVLHGLLTCERVSGENDPVSLTGHQET